MNEDSINKNTQDVSEGDEIDDDLSRLEEEALEISDMLEEDDIPKPYNPLKEKQKKKESDKTPSPSEKSDTETSSSPKASFSGNANSKIQNDIKDTAKETKLPKQPAKTSVSPKKPLKSSPEDYFSVQVTDDYMKAYLSFKTYDGPQESKPQITEEKIYNALKKKNVTAGIITKQLAVYVKNYNLNPKGKTNLLIAEGTEATEGKDAEIEWEIEFKTAKEFGMEEKLGELPAVEIHNDDIVAKIKKERIGEKGTNIKGDITEIKKGKNPYKAENGIYVEEENDLYIYKSDTEGYAVKTAEGFYKCIKCVNGKIKVDISDNFLKADLTITPSHGIGDPVTFEEIKKQLEEQSVSYGMNNDLIVEKLKEIEKNKKELTFTACRGTAPMPLKIKILKEPENHSNGQKELKENDNSKQISSQKLHPPEEKYRGKNIYGRPARLLSLALTADKCRLLVSSLDVSNDENKDLYNTVSSETMINLIEKSGIKRDVDKKNITKIIDEWNKNKNTLTDEILAETSAPYKNGENAKIINEAAFSPPADLGYDAEIGELCAEVQKEDTVAQIKNASEGEEGFNLFDEKIIGKSGTNTYDFSNEFITAIDEKKGVTTYKAPYDGMVIKNGNAYTMERFRNGSVKIMISEDELHAFCSLLPPVGIGKPLEKAMIDKAIKEHEISYGIKHDIIESKFEEFQKNQETLDFEIACGISPIHGSDGRIEWFIEKEADGSFYEDESGKIDYKSKNNTINVSKDQNLFEITRPTKAEKTGKNLFSKDLPARDGTPVTVNSADNIVKVEDNDLGRDLYKSEIDGEFLYDPGSNSAKVIKVKTVKNIDIEFGNLNFSGKVTVEEAITDNMKVDISEDLHVKGNIHLSQITVGGNLICEGGIVTKRKGKIVCAGNIEAKFIENSIIECLGTVNVEKAILNSTIYSQKEIIVSGDKGHILGSQLVALEKIEARTIGTSSGGRNKLELGSDYNRTREYNDHTVFLKRLKEEVKILNLKIGHIRKKNGEDPKKYSVELKKHYVDIVKKKNEKSKLFLSTREKAVKLLEDIKKERPCELIVHDTIYPDNTIIMSAFKTTIQNPEKNIVFFLTKGQENIERRSASE